MSADRQAVTRARMLLGFLPDETLPTDQRTMLALEAIAFNLSEIKIGVERLIMELVERRHDGL